MEAPATVSFLATWMLCEVPGDGSAPSQLTSYILAAIWIRHYGNRGWYFPLNMRVAKGATSSFNVVVSSIGAIFTGLHGHLNARMFRALGAHYTAEWLSDPRFVFGFIVYEFGFWVTIHSEYVMRNLRPKD